MSIALSEFWTRLVRSGITDAAGCKQLAAAYSQANQGTPPSDSQALAEFLMESGALTRFQSEALFANPPRELKSGNFLIRSDRGPSPFGRWIPVRRLDDGRSGLLYRVPLDQLAGGRDQWLKAHQEVSVKGLQQFEYENLSSWALVFSPIANGVSLHEHLATSPVMDASAVCKIGIRIAKILESMHLRPLVHGAVRADHVWWDQGQDVTLLRDPSCPPLGVAAAGSDHWIDAVEGPEFYAAPELNDPNAAPSVQSDIYSLGCLLFRLATGRYPIDGSSPANTLAAHSTEMPPELSEAIAKGEAGEPLFRVLAFAMAKSPSARFASAAQLNSALTAILSLLENREPSDSSAQPSADVTGATMSKPTNKSVAQPSARRGTGKSATNPSPSKPIPGPSNSTSESTNPAKKEAKQSPQSRKSTSKEPSKRVAKQEAKKQADNTPDVKKRRAEEKGDSNADSVARERKTSVAAEKTDAAAEKNTDAAKKAGGGKSVKADAPTVPMHTGDLPTRAGVIASEVTQPLSSPPSAAVPTPVHSASTGAPVVASGETTSQNKTVGVTTSGDVTRASASSPVAAQHGQPPAPPTEGEARRPLRARRKKKSKAPIVLGALCVAVLMLVIGLAVPRGSDPEPDVTPKRPRIPTVIPAVTNRPPTNPEPTPPPDAVSGYELVADGRLLFVPPYPADSNTAPLELLPPGPAVILFFRYSQVLESSLGDDLVASLSPELEQLLAKISERAKVSPDDIETCSVALHPGKEGWPQVSLAITLKEPVDAKELLEVWQVAASRTKDGATIYAGDSVDGDAFYFPGDTSSPVRRFAVGSVEQVSEVAAAEGGAIPLPRSAQTLWNSSSDQADFVALISPNFLFADGREMLASTAPEFSGPLKSALQPDVASMLLALDIDNDNLFVETRLAPSGGISEAALMRAVSERVSQWPQWADEFIVDSVPDPSWRLLASRLPSMMRFVSDNVRFGVSDGAVVANTYLPAQAVPQVTLATLLAMNTPAGNAVAVATPKAQPPLTVEEMLDRKMSVAFEQESLEFAIDNIVGAFKKDLPSGSTMPSVRIIGGDLQLMGITQNQQVRDFSKDGVPLRRVLTDLVIGANPDKSATGPKDVKQALIWVVADDEENPGKKVILVTTRQAADGKYELPTEFVAE